MLKERLWKKEKVFYCNNVALFPALLNKEPCIFILHEAPKIM